MHSQNQENILYADWLILLSYCLKSLACLYSLGNITYFLGKITYFLGNITYFWAISLTSWAR